MLELPDVENFKRYFDRTACNRKITHAEVRAGRVLRGTSASRLARALANHKLTRSRHGKQGAHDQGRRSYYYCPKCQRK